MGGGKKKRDRIDKHKQSLGDQLENPETYGVRVGALQAGMHHDGMHYFPLPYGSQSSTRGLLAINHEYSDDGEN